MTIYPCSGIRNNQTVFILKL